MIRKMYLLVEMNSEISILKSIRYHSDRIADVQHDSLGNHVILLPDESVHFKQYATDTDINGNFVIKGRCS